MVFFNGILRIMWWVIRVVMKVASTLKKKQKTIPVCNDIIGPLVMFLFILFHHQLSLL